MTLLEQLKDLANELETKSAGLDVNSPLEIEAYLLYLAHAKSKVNMLLPETQFYFDDQLGNVTEKIMTDYKDNLQGNSSFIKNLIQAQMKEYRRVNAYADRVSSTIERQSENYRSVLSALKQEFRNV